MKKYNLLVVLTACFFIQACKEVHKEYYDTGELKAEFEVENGKENGQIKSYYKSGKLQGEGCCFENGLFNGIMKEYSENGEVLKEYSLRNTKIHGLYKDFYPSGKLKSEMPFIDGKQEGVVKEYYEDGNIKAIQKFRHHLADGEARIFHPNGKLEMYAVWKNDSAQYLIEFDSLGKKIGEKSVVGIIALDTIYYGEDYFRGHVYMPFSVEGKMQVFIGAMDSVARFKNPPKEIRVFKNEATYSTVYEDQKAGDYEMAGIVQITEKDGYVRKYPFRKKYKVIDRR